MTLKEFSEQSKPRERAMSKGLDSLSDIELIAIIIGSGTKSNSALGIANDIISYLGSIAFITYDTLKCLNIKGLGKVKMLCIASCFELARRINSNKVESTHLDSSIKLYNYLLPRFFGLEKERFIIVLLDKRMKLVYSSFIDSENRSKINLSFNKLFKICTNVSAYYAVIAHNHPSNVAIPSKDDDETTSAIKVSLRLIDIILLDHLIVSDSGFFSYKDNGKI